MRNRDEAHEHKHMRHDSWRNISGKQAEERFVFCEPPNSLRLKSERSTRWIINHTVVGVEPA